MLCFRRKEGRKPSKRSLNFYIELCISYFNNCLAIKKEKVLEFPCCAHYSYFSSIIYYIECTKNFFLMCKITLCTFFTHVANNFLLHYVFSAVPNGTLAVCM